MKYAVKIKGARLPYACVGCHPKPCGHDWEGKPFFSDFLRATDDDNATTTDRSKAEDVAKARGGRVVRVLSHEEAKRKAAAVALLKHAEWCRANKQGTWSSVAFATREEASEAALMMAKKRLTGLHRQIARVSGLALSPKWAKVKR